MAKKEYSNGEVTVVWQSDLCIHSENCFRGLPRVFNPKNRPWVNIEGAGTSQIVDQVKKCPSGALSYYMVGDAPNSGQEASQQVVEVTPNGPLMAYGSLKVKLNDGTEISREKVTAFCRCGASQNKPFCDGSHKKVDFQG